MASTTTLNSNVTVAVTPRIKTYTVTLGTHTGASVTMSYGSTSITNGNLTNVPYGTVVTVSATASAGYTLGAVSPSNSITVTADTTVTVSATLNTYTVTLGSHTGANVVMSYGSTSVTNGNLTNVPHGTTVKVAATAQAGYTISAVNPSTSFVLTGARTVTVSATKNTYTVTLGSHPNASVVLSYGSTSVTNSNLTNVPYGTTVTATVTPSSTYAVSSVSFS